MELVIAIALLALMAVVSWRALAGMVAAQTQLDARADEVVTAQSVLGQWRADLDALTAVHPQRPIDWDGRVLRLVRRHPSDPAQGLLVVGWATRGVAGQTRWLRWQSPPLRDRASLAAAWAAAATWARSPTPDDRSREVALTEVLDCQVFFYRGNAWSSPFSSADPQSAAQALNDPVIPDGVRLVLTLPATQALGGTLTSDWVRPTLSAGQGG